MAELIWAVRENRVELLRDGAVVGVLEPEPDGGARGWAVGDCWPDGEARVTYGGPWSADTLMEIILDRAAAVEAAREG